MEVIFIDVGYGDAILLKDGSSYALIDGGSSLAEEYVGNRISVAEYFKKNHVLELEFVILTHIHEDHVGGLVEILETLKVKKLYLPFLPDIKEYDDLDIPNLEKTNLMLYQKALNMFKSLFFIADKHAIEIENLYELKSLRIFDSYDLVVLEPFAKGLQRYTENLESIFRLNDNEEKKEMLIKLDYYSNIISLVLNLKILDKNIILAGDNCPKFWRPNTFNYLKNGNVLKLPHHGQQDSVNDELLDVFKGQIVVTSSSSDRRNNSCNPIVYDRLLNENEDLICLFTDEMHYEPYFRRSSNDSKCIRLSVFEDSIDVVCE